MNFAEAQYVYRAKFDSFSTAQKKFDICIYISQASADEIIYRDSRKTEFLKCEIIQK